MRQHIPHLTVKWLLWPNWQIDNKESCQTFSVNHLIDWSTNRCRSPNMFCLEFKMAHVLLIRSDRRQKYLKNPLDHFTYANDFSCTNILLFQAESVYRRCLKPKFEFRIFWLCFWTLSSSTRLTVSASCCLIRPVVNSAEPSLSFLSLHSNNLSSFTQV